MNEPVETKAKSHMVYNEEGNILSLDCDYLESDLVYECYRDELPEEYISFARHLNLYQIVNSRLVKKEDTSPIEEEQEKMLQTMMTKSFRSNYLSTLSDSEAVKIPYCYPQWETYIGLPLSKLDSHGNPNRIGYKGELWEVRMDISVVLEDQYPSTNTASLYKRIDNEHSGTIDDPIPYDMNMEVYEGKYYIENAIVYKCIRSSGQPLYNTCANLVSIYFEIVKE